MVAQEVCSAAPGHLRGVCQNRHSSLAIARERHQPRNGGLPGGWLDCPSARVEGCERGPRLVARLERSLSILSALFALLGGPGPVHDLCPRSYYPACDERKMPRTAGR